MTVPSEQSRIQYETDGVSVSFPVPFRFIEPQHLLVTRQHDDQSSVLALGSDYTVSGANNPSGGTITTVAAYPSGDVIAIERIVPITQETAYQRNDPFPERAHEQALDKLTMICQMLGSILGLTPGAMNRALLLGVADRDGQGAYRAGGNRIQDLGDAVAMHDAVNKKVLLDYLSTIATDGSGEIVVERLADTTDPGNGAGMVGTPWGTLRSIVEKSTYRTPLDFGAIGDGVADDTSALEKWVNSGEKLAMPPGNYRFRSDAPLQILIPGTHILGLGSGSRIELGQRNAGRGLIEVSADDCVIDGLYLANPDLLAMKTGWQSFALLNRAHRTRMLNMRVIDFEMGLTTSSGAGDGGLSPGGEYYDAWYINNFIRVFGQGGGTPDPGDGYGEDRGDGITHWGSRAHIIGNTVMPKGGTDCRGAIFCEGLNDYALDKSSVDFDSIAIITNNYVGLSDDQSNGGGRFRRGCDVENYAYARVSDNIVRGCSWFCYQAMGDVPGLEMSNNTAIVDCPASNNNGSSWNPQRAASNLFLNGHSPIDVTFKNNKAIFLSGGHRLLNISGKPGNSAPKNLLIDGLTASVVDSVAIADGIEAILVDSGIDASTSVKITNTSVTGPFQRIVAMFAYPNMLFHNCNFIGASQSGIYAAGGSRFSIEDSYISNGVEIVGAASVSIKNTKIDSLLGNNALSLVGNIQLEVENSSAIGQGRAIGIYAGTPSINKWINNSGFAYLSGEVTALVPSIPGTGSRLISQLPMTAATDGDRVIIDYAETKGNAVNYSAGVNAFGEIWISASNVQFDQTPEYETTIKFRVERR